MDNVRIAVDVGGTFTDIALEHAEGMTTKKVLTTPDKPEEGVLSGIRSTLTEANISPSEINILIHGTTLATNALIERKGAKVALITTEGLRDSVEMAQENRFEQYDIKPEVGKLIVFSNSQLLHYVSKVEDSERFVLSFWYKRLTPPAD